MTDKPMLLTDVDVKISENNSKRMDVTLTFNGEIKDGKEPVLITSREQAREVFGETALLDDAFRRMYREYLRYVTGHIIDDGLTDIWPGKEPTMITSAEQAKEMYDWDIEGVFEEARNNPVMVMPMKEIEADE